MSGGGGTQAIRRVNSAKIKNQLFSLRNAHQVFYLMITKDIYPRIVFIEKNWKERAHMLKRFPNTNALQFDWSILYFILPDFRTHFYYFCIITLMECFCNFYHRYKNKKNKVYHTFSLLFPFCISFWQIRRKLKSVYFFLFSTISIFSQNIHVSIT